MICIIKGQSSRNYTLVLRRYTQTFVWEFQVSADLFLGTLPSSMHHRLWEDHGSATRAASFSIVNLILGGKSRPARIRWSSSSSSFALFSHRRLNRSEAKTRQLIITHSCEKTRGGSLLGMLHSVLPSPLRRRAPHERLSSAGAVVCAISLFPAPNKEYVSEHTRPTSALN